MTFIYVLLAAILTILMVILVKRRSEPLRMERYQQEFRRKYEETLNVEQTEIVSEALIEKLNQAMDTEYMERINTDFRMHHPRYSQHQVNELWRELKRYFIMTAVFGKIEMFHATVDELWHIMLHDKAKYDAFCHNFLGQRIQHHPHSEPVFKPVERTLFDFYYVQLFTVDSTSIHKWGKFFKHDKATASLHDFKTLELEQLKQKYMRNPTSAEAEKTFEMFTAFMKEDHTKLIVDWEKRYHQTDYAAPAYFTYASSDNHDLDFKYLFGDDFAKSQNDAYHINGHGSDHGGYDSGSDSSSCSSCSSCSS
ncbi:hypothetical protein ACQKL5_18550 [Peribacillus sp. NPDC097675]|uniref:hypothetical protein n=1 Tax=Peribacillus sp. NPDC097675 TaxID=3390618 RepID=UPI003D06DD41